jgi:ribosomal-protein-alanine N-acetyltransferase
VCLSRFLPPSSLDPLVFTSALCMTRMALMARVFGGREWASEGDTVEEQPTIELAGIRLRPLRGDDATACHAYLSDPQVTELTSYPPMSFAEVESMLARVAQAYSAGTSCRWAVAIQDNDQLVETCGFNKWSRIHGWAELAYELARPYWGRGIMSQAVAACLGRGFGTSSFNRMHAFAMIGNHRSELLLERAGFAREGCLRSYRMCRGLSRDFSVFSFLRPEWEVSRRGLLTSGCG